MNNKLQFIQYINTLKDEAIKQNKAQGLELFSKILEESEKADFNFKTVLNKTQKSLGGILAHGSINDKEFEIIQKIFNLKI